MKKIPCNECGALILPTTAVSTGGICMACKQGIRKSMEASRAYYQSLKAFDPFRELWKSLVQRSSNNPKLTGWSVQEKIYFSVCLLDGEIYNGGFDQYFYNSSGDYYHLAAKGLENLGAVYSLALLRAAADKLFGKDEPPASQIERWQIMNVKTRRLSEVTTRYHRASQLERLDKRFCDDPDRLGDLLTAYAKEHGLNSPFETGPN